MNVIKKALELLGVFRYSGIDSEEEKTLATKSIIYIVIIIGGITLLITLI